MQDKLEESYPRGRSDYSGDNVVASRVTDTVLTRFQAQEQEKNLF